ncbi:hypothetical protein CPB83DRAFT_842188 [Crepidotus variabilis]|uniref:Uncharacterized protein n=1 Tax=Crepidotus variabilis TaxID=179855 RepID=A0A9P6EVB1_9AGAR|nr:hypothetical protein CPB83DRAFT_842188 [Crepidotus variabilis]
MFSMHRVVLVGLVSRSNDHATLQVVRFVQAGPTSERTYGYSQEQLYILSMAPKKRPRFYHEARREVHSAL